MVSLTFSSPLPNVLGRTPGLFAFTIHSPPRTGRWPNRVEPVRPSFRGYQHELLLSESSLVVLRHAHSILPSLSPPFLGSNKTWTMAVLSCRVRSWIRCALF